MRSGWSRASTERTGTLILSRLAQDPDPLHRVGFYKAAEPEETIERVRGLLRRCDLFVVERHWQLRPGHWASVQLQIPGTGFSVNGKGIDPRFALASAYGELMERLQFLNGLGLAYPDQQWLAAPPMAPTWPAELVARLAKSNGKTGPGNDGTSDDIACVPFYHLNSGEERLLPIEALRQTALTNGSCAGNTPPEALIHGLCEILERFVLRRIIVEQPVLPSIPLAALSGLPIAKTLSILQREGLDVVIKDCSFGGTWPVVGLMLRQGERGVFHLGASPAFPLALERCLTEIFQGISLERLIASMPLLPTAGPACAEEASLRFVRAAKNIERLVEPCLLETAGQYSKDFVDGAGGDMVSAQTMRSLMTRIIDAGHEVYVRDIAFLGVPAFTLYIPGMSTLQDEVYHRYAQTDASDALAAIYLRIDQASDDELLRLAKAIQAWLRSPVRYAWQPMQQSLLGLPHGQQVFDQALEPALFAALLFDEAGAPESAATLLQRALADTIATGEINASPGSQSPARLRFGAYLAARGRGATPDAAREQAFTGVLDPVSQRLARRLSGRIGHAEALGVPLGCYNCADCPHASGCEVPGRQGLIQRLQERMRHVGFDQRWLATLFA